MRKIILILFCAGLACATHAGNADLLRTREMYYKASFDRNDAELFEKFLSASPDLGGSLLSGYRGMCYMIKANHAWNPYNKLSYFVKGKNMLDGAIGSDRSNVELRFLRFCVQTNAPGFLGYSDRIEEDKAVIMSGYQQLTDKDLKMRIKNYLATSKHCSAKDLAVLK